MIAALSMLHEPPDANSATRRFRERAVLEWTRDRLRRSRRIDAVRVLCWSDQVDAVRAAGVDACVIGDRRRVARIEAIATARRWSDGWRGGLLSSTEFDLGFHAQALREIDAPVVLVDPSAGLIDPQIVDAVVERTDEDRTEMAFAPAAPGFCVIALQPAVIARLESTGLSPGVLFTYQPDAPTRDPLSSPGCVPPPLAVARTTRRFKLDSQWQIDRLARAVESLDDAALRVAPAESIVRAVESLPVDALPRDLTLELTTRRHTRPVFSLLSRGLVNRRDISLAEVERTVADLARRDDSRLTLAGVGDPILHDRFEAIVLAARGAGISGIRVETDLLCDPDLLRRLAELPIDAISVHLPGATAGIYAAVMGVDRLTDAVSNARRLIAHREGRGTPIVAPTFVKTRVNLAEMEPWYDAWIRATGSAVIVPATDLAGAIEDVSVGDMAPPGRVPCRRIASRLTVLCDGSTVACEEDLAARRVLAGAGEGIERAWIDGLGALRSLHADRRWDSSTPCDRCREWHRP